MGRGGRWRVRLAAAAENDFRNILGWTSERFGEAQARVYAETLITGNRIAGGGAGGSRIAETR